MYNGVNSSIDAMRGKHDIFGSMGAGAVTGALFKSTGMCSRFEYKTSSNLVFASWS